LPVFPILRNLIELKEITKNRIQGITRMSGIYPLMRAEFHSISRIVHSHNFKH
jgi:hypothetical protein